MRIVKRWTGVCALLCGMLPSLSVFAAETRERSTSEVIDVAPVWSGHPVGFALLTAPPRQFVAFYDAQRRMTVGCRSLDSREWSLVRLPSSVGWDSHNYVTMALDDGGYLHVSGNMHVRPLIYFRTTRPYDIASLQQLPAMVGRNEQRCTYPRFLRGPEGALLFTYRDGSSGNGNTIWNAYDPQSKTWRRLLDEPLFDGEGERNAYFTGPTRDSRGLYHIAWVWRETPDCATNHDLCYARSKNLRDWEKSDGTPLRLPITLKTAEIVDPVPVGGGIINSNIRLGFDRDGRPILSYHKFDARGNTQIYNARREADGWKICRASDWLYRWEFQGGGSIDAEIHVGAVAADAEGKLTQGYEHAKYGTGVWLLDQATLRPTGQAPRPTARPRLPIRPESTWPGMRSRTAADLGESGARGVAYLLRWETLGPNRDRPRPGDPPPPSMLRLYKLLQR